MNRVPSLQRYPESTTSKEWAMLIRTADNNDKALRQYSSVIDEDLDLLQKLTWSGF